MTHFVSPEVPLDAPGANTAVHDTHSFKFKIASYYGPILTTFCEAISLSQVAIMRSRKALEYPSIGKQLNCL